MDPAQQETKNNIIFVIHMILKYEAYALLFHIILT